MLLHCIALRWSCLQTGRGLGFGQSAVTYPLLWAPPQTVEEMAVKSSTSETEGSVAKFSEFLTEGRKVAGEVSTEEILAYSRLFKDELTLDNLSREQLVACCRLLGITPIGTSQFLRFQLRTTLKQLRMDDVVSPTLRLVGQRAFCPVRLPLPWSPCPGCPWASVPGVWLSSLAHGSDLCSPTDPSDHTATTAAVHLAGGRRVDEQ